MMDSQVQAQAYQQAAALQAAASQEAFAASMGQAHVFQQADAMHPGPQGSFGAGMVHPQAFQQAAAMQAAASQEAFAASMGRAQENQAAQLVQQAAMAGFVLCPTQAAQMAQEATFYAHQAFAQQQATYFSQVSCPGCRVCTMPSMGHCSACRVRRGPSKGTTHICSVSSLTAELHCGPHSSLLPSCVLRKMMSPVAGMEQHALEGRHLCCLYSLV